MGASGKVWRYIGDMRCPCCGRYSKVHAKGFRQNTELMLKCKTTDKVFMKRLGYPWKAESEYQEMMAIATGKVKVTA